MANVRHKHSIFVDATGNITVDAVKPILWGVLITPAVATLKRDLSFMWGPSGTYALKEVEPQQISTFTLKETNSSGTTKVHVILERPESKYFDFTGFEGGGIELTTTFNITTLTNITNVILFGSWLAPTGKAV